MRRIAPLVAAAGISLLGIRAAPAQPVYQARLPTYACVSGRATAALTGNDPRMSDPGWVNYVMSDGQCVQVTPDSQWSLVRPNGSLLLLRNLVPGTGAQFYFSRAAMTVLGPSPRPATPPLPPPARWTAVSGTALSVTGSITVSPARITFANGRFIDVRFEGQVTVPDFVGQSVPAQLYRVTSRTNPALLRGNRLCGANPPQWITIRDLPRATGAEGAPKALDVYDTAQPPPAGGSCANYNYDAAG